MPRPFLAASLAVVTAGTLSVVGPASGTAGGAAAPVVVTSPRDSGFASATTRLAPAPVEIATHDFWSWALLDRATGEITGASNLDATSTTASMIKIWLAADFLRLATEREQRPGRQRLADLSVMIRDSENDPATRLYDELGGADTIHRLIDICGLTDSAPSWRWSLTELSARDAARMAACVADGRGAGAEWTGWLLREMRLVRGRGDFGIRDAFPANLAARIAIKNGYFARPEDGLWHVNCLAVSDGWALTVIQRYPEELGLAHGAGICRSVAGQLRADH
jgi:hypothetical protein